MPSLLVPQRSDAIAASLRTNVDGILMGNEAGQDFSVLTFIFPVELPGIELGTEIGVTCGDVEVDDAKARETTWRDLRVHPTVLMASTLAATCHGRDDRGS